METRTVYLSPGEIRLESQELPPLGPTNVLVKTHQASICGSERYYYQGISVRPQDEAHGNEETELSLSGKKTGRKYAYPMGPLGHEGGGTIIEMGSAVETYLGGGQVKVGDRVGSLTYPTYSDYWVTDTAHVQPIPDSVSFEVGCLYEPLGCVGWAAIHMGVKLGDTVAVNGVGFAGNILLQGALKAGASMVIAVDVVDSKLAVAKEIGAHHVINAREQDPKEAVLELTRGLGVDVSVEAVGGKGQGLVQALDMVAHNGILALYGDNYAPVNEFCFHRFHEDGLEVRNLNAVHYTKLRSIENMREAYRAVERGVFDTDVILRNSVRYTLQELPAVFARENKEVDEQSSLKTIITP